ncbi:hypothetical protein ABZ372_19435, partial [Streptomyces sp. NPDC005921]
ADTDPLEYKQRKHPDLDITEHGLTLWDLERDGLGTGRCASVQCGGHPRPDPPLRSRQLGTDPDRA